MALLLNNLIIGCLQLPTCKKSNQTYYGTCLVCDDGYKLKDGVCKIPLCGEEGGTCVVGDVYYYNGTPIGVVFYVYGITTKITALKDINYSGA